MKPSKLILASFGATSALAHSNSPLVFFAKFGEKKVPLTSNPSFDHSAPFCVSSNGLSTSSPTEFDFSGQYPVTKNSPTPGFAGFTNGMIGFGPDVPETPMEFDSTMKLLNGPFNSCDFSETNACGIYQGEVSVPSGTCFKVDIYLLPYDSTTQSAEKYLGVTEMNARADAMVLIESTNEQDLGESNDYDFENNKRHFQNNKRNDVNGKTSKCTKGKTDCLADSKELKGLYVEVNGEMLPLTVIEYNERYTALTYNNYDVIFVPFEDKKDLLVSDNLMVYKNLREFTDGRIGFGNEYTGSELEISFDTYEQEIIDQFYSCQEGKDPQPYIVRGQKSGFTGCFPVKVFLFYINLHTGRPMKLRHVAEVKQELIGGRNPTIESDFEAIVRENPTFPHGIENWGYFVADGDWLIPLTHVRRDMGELELSVLAFNNKANNEKPAVFHISDGNYTYTDQTTTPGATAFYNDGLYFGELVPPSSLELDSYRRILCKDTLANESEDGTYTFITIMPRGRKFHRVDVYLMPYSTEKYPLKPELKIKHDLEESPKHPEGKDYASAKFKAIIQKHPKFPYGIGEWSYFVAEASGEVFPLTSIRWDQGDLKMSVMSYKTKETRPTVFIILNNSTFTVDSETPGAMSMFQNYFFVSEFMPHTRLNLSQHHKCMETQHYSCPGPHDGFRIISNTNVTNDMKSCTPVDIYLMPSSEHAHLSKPSPNDPKATGGNASLPKQANVETKSEKNGTKHKITGHEGRDNKGRGHKGQVPNGQENDTGISRPRTSFTKSNEAVPNNDRDGNIIYGNNQRHKKINTKINDYIYYSLRRKKAKGYDITLEFYVYDFKRRTDATIIISPEPTSTIYV